MKEKWNEIWYQLRSMRVQLLLVMFFVGLIPVILFSIIFTRTYNGQTISQKNDEVRSYGNVISNLIANSGYLSGKDSTEVEKEAEEISNAYQGRVMIIDQNLNIVKDTYGIETGNTLISTEVIQCFSNKDAFFSNEIGDYIS